MSGSSKPKWWQNKATPKEIPTLPVFETSVNSEPTTSHHGIPGPRVQKLPQVSLNKSKNNMNAPSPGCVRLENIFENEYLTAHSLEGVCAWFDDWEDLINFRRACTLYASVGIYELKKRFVYRITKRFALYFWLTFLDYVPEEIPCTRFHLEPKWIISSPINTDINAPYDTESRATEIIMKNIFQKIGHHLLYLRMDEFSVDGGLETLRNVLFSYAPKMRHLVFNRPTFLKHCLERDIWNNGGPFHDHLSEENVLKLAQVPLHLPVDISPRPLLVAFYYRAVQGSWFPLHWLEIFLGFPNIQDLKVDDVCPLEMEEILNAIVSEKLPRPLPLKRLNAFYTFSRKPTFEQDEAMIPGLVPLYMDLKFKFTHLNICIKRALDPLQVRNFLMNYCDTLEHLVLTREARKKKDNNLELIFKCAFFSSLRSLEVTNDIVQSFRFLQSMPQLEKLVMNESDPTDRLPGIIFAQLFSPRKKVYNNDGNDETSVTQFVGEALNQLHVSNVDFPMFPDNSPITFDLAYTFPQLTRLQINDVGDGEIRAMFNGLLKLRTLFVYGNHVTITDNGIIGVENIAKFIRTAKATLMKQRQRQFPYVGNLKFLRSFVIDHQTTGSLNITKISLDYGLADCENLNQIVLYRTRVTMADAVQIRQSLPVTSFVCEKGWK